MSAVYCTPPPRSAVSRRGVCTRSTGNPGKTLSRNQEPPPPSEWFGGGHTVTEDKIRTPSDLTRDENWSRWMDGNTARLSTCRGPTTYYAAALPSLDMPTHACMPALLEDGMKKTWKKQVPGSLGSFESSFPQGTATGTVLDTRACYPVLLTYCLQSLSPPCGLHSR